jgi:metal-responsive CopG/Arc/MetJ family transcriptional regulator
VPNNDPKKGSFLRVREDEDIMEKLREIAKRDQYSSVSDMVRKVIDDFIAKSVLYQRIGANQYVKRSVSKKPKK